VTSPFIPVIGIATPIILITALPGRNLDDANSHGAQRFRVRLFESNTLPDRHERSFADERPGSQPRVIPAAGVRVQQSQQGWSATEWGERQPRNAEVRLQRDNWQRRSRPLDGLIVATQNGERQIYENLLRDSDVWLRRYKLWGPPRSASEGTGQDTRLTIHVNRYLCEYPCPLVRGAADSRDL
jgi:hypothetical protein